MIGVKPGSHSVSYIKDSPDEIWREAYVKKVAPALESYRNRDTTDIIMEDDEVAFYDNYFSLM